MNQLEQINRRIELKSQAIELIKGEMADLKVKKILALIRQRYEGELKAEFDPVISHKVDCLTFLVEN